MALGYKLSSSHHREMSIVNLPWAVSIITALGGQHCAEIFRQSNIARGGMLLDMPYRELYPDTF